MNTLSEKSAGSDIPLLKDGLLVCTSAKEKVENLGQTFASKCQLQHAEDSTLESVSNPIKNTGYCSLKRQGLTEQQLLRKLNSDKATCPEGV